MFEPPFVREGVTAEGKLEPVPFQDKADRTVDSVNGRDGPNRHPILLVDRLIDELVVEFSDLDFQPLGVYVSLS